MENTNPDQLTASLVSAVSNLVAQVTTKFGQVQGATADAITAAVNDAKAEILGGAPAEGNTLKKLHDRIASLDETYATDADLAAKIAAINEAWNNADQDMLTMLANKADTSYVDTQINLAKQAAAGATAQSEARFDAALIALTTAFEQGASNIAAVTVQ